MDSKTKATLLGAAFAGLMLAGCASNSNGLSSAEAKVSGECHGVNSCKGTGDCGGKGHSCAGKNSCKGHGWQKMKQGDCLDKGGTFKKS